MAYSTVIRNFKTLLYSGYSFNVDHGLKLQLVNTDFLVDFDAFVADITKSNISDMTAYLIDDSLKEIGACTLDTSGDYIILKANSDVTYTISSFTDFIGCIIYDDSGTLVCYRDFGKTDSTINGSLRIPLSLGILKTPF